jgi:hypothetical protein
MHARSERFDFNEWKELSETDPEAFEVRRRKVIEAEIRLAPARQQQRLRRLQWKIDLVRQRYKHPLVSSAKLFEMMWQKVYGENGLLEALNTPQRRAGGSPSATAEVIQFPDRKK